MGPTEDDKKNIATRITYLPGDKWPENVLIDSIRTSSNKGDLCVPWGVGLQELEDVFNCGACADKHNEFREIAHRIQIKDNQILRDAILFYKKDHPNEIQAIAGRIMNLLPKA